MYTSYIYNPSKQLEMSDRLKILTDKIYHEGIEKAQAESERILDQAQQEAKDLIAQAHKDREELIQKTEKEMDAYRKKVLSEIRMSARKAANLIKKQLHEIIVEKAIHRPVAESLQNPEVLNEILKSTAASLQKDQSGIWKIKVSEEILQKITATVDAAKDEVLAEGVHLSGGASIKGGFTVTEENGTYKMVFDETTFVEFLNQFLKLETQKLLSE